MENYQMRRGCGRPYNTTCGMGNQREMSCTRRTLTEKPAVSGKQKQQEQIEQAIAGLLEVVEEAQRKHWQLWVEESTKQFVAAVMRHYEQREEYSV